MPTTESLITQQKARARGWWIATLVLALVLLVCVAIVAAGATRDVDGNPLIESPGAVLVGFFALLGTLSTAFKAVLSPLQNNLEVVKQNVQNDHIKEDGTPLIMRDDLDDKHDELKELILDGQKETRRDIGGIREELRGVRRDAASDREATSDRFDAVENRFVNFEKQIDRLSRSIKEH